MDSITRNKRKNKDHPGSARGRRVETQYKTVNIVIDYKRTVGRVLSVRL